MLADPPGVSCSERACPGPFVGVMKPPPAAPADDAANANVSIEYVFLNFAVPMAEANMVATDALVTASICGFVSISPKV